MKWDIDKAVTQLEADGVPGTSVTRVLISDPETLRRCTLFNVTKEEQQHGVKAWCLGLGKAQHPKVFTYDRTIRGAYLKARKVIQKMSPQARETYGIKITKKRNSYASARKKKS